MEQVFISHSSVDRQFVEGELVPLLRGHGLRPWYSADDIPTASRWETEIRRGLEQSQWFIVVLSPEAAESEWVQAEVHWAMAHRQGRIVPVMIRECDPASVHLQLIRYQYVDFQQGLLQARSRLLSVWGVSASATNALQVRVAISFEGGCEERTILVNETAIIGRHPDVALRVHDPGVSRHHAALKVSAHEEKKTLWLADLASRNPTFLNGKALTKPMCVSSGDEIRIHAVCIVIKEIKDPDSGSDEATAADG